LRSVEQPRFPCCGRRVHVDFGPGRPALRRCRACKATYLLALEPGPPGADGETVWTVHIEPVGNGHQA
jgi:hypothetical protein